MVEQAIAVVGAAEVAAVGPAHASGGNVLSTAPASTLHVDTAIGKRPTNSASLPSRGGNMDATIRPCAGNQRPPSAISMESMEKTHDQAPDASPSRARRHRGGFRAGLVRDRSIHHRAPLRVLRNRCA